MSVIAYAPRPCGAVQGRRGRCSRLATKSWKVPRFSKRRGVIYFYVSRCEAHPPRNGESSEPIEYRLDELHAIHADPALTAAHGEPVE